MVFIIAWPTAAFAQVWSGEQKRDPITHQPYSIAAMRADDAGAFIALRCKHNEFDIIWQVKTSRIPADTALEINYRIGDFPSGKSVGLLFSGLPSNIGVRVSPELKEQIKEVMRGKTLALRVTNGFGNEYTSVFRTAMPSNSLAVIGRVLADCGVAEFPSAEIEAASKPTDTPAKQPRPKR